MILWCLHKGRDATVWYLRLEGESHVSVKFLAAKTWITPVGKAAMPQPELWCCLHYCSPSLWLLLKMHLSQNWFMSCCCFWSMELDHWLCGQVTEYSCAYVYTLCWTVEPSNSGRMSGLCCVQLSSWVLSYLIWVSSKSVSFIPYIIQIVVSRVPWWLLVCEQEVKFGGIEHHMPMDPIPDTAPFIRLSFHYIEELLFRYCMHSHYILDCIFKEGIKVFYT